MSSEITLGGQAVIEGVLMRTQKEYAIAVRDPKGKIVVKKEKIKTAAKKFKLLQLQYLYSRYSQ